MRGPARRPRTVAGALVLAAGALLAFPAAADIWKRVDERGVTHYTDDPVGSGWKLILRTRKPRSSGAGSTAALAKKRARYAPLIEQAARRYRMDPQLVHAVVRAESAYDSKAVSRAGAVGLMQLMPETAARYGVRDRRDPQQNLNAGVRYLRDLLHQFRNVALALAAYNAGENAVVRHGHRVPPFRETQDYVRKVIGYYRAQKKSS